MAKARPLKMRIAEARAKLERLKDLEQLERLRERMRERARATKPARRSFR